MCGATDPFFFLCADAQGIALGLGIIVMPVPLTKKKTRETGLKCK